MDDKATFAVGQVRAKFGSPTFPFVFVIQPNLTTGRGLLSRSAAGGNSRTPDAVQTVSDRLKLTAFV